MSNDSSSSPTGWRILGFGKHPEIAAAIQEKLRSLGFRATNFVLPNDEAGDARLVAELKRTGYDGVAIGGYINGADILAILRAWWRERNRRFFPRGPTTWISEIPCRWRNDTSHRT